MNQPPVHKSPGSAGYLLGFVVALTVTVVLVQVRNSLPESELKFALILLTPAVVYAAVRAAQWLSVARKSGGNLD